MTDRTMRRFLCDGGVLPLAMALAVCLGGRVQAAEPEISPLRVDLSPREKTAIVTVRNRSSDPAGYEVKVLAWDQRPDGEMKLSPTQEIIASPALLQLAPGENRSLRITTAGAFGAIEKSFRLIIEELAPPAKADDPPQVRVLSRIGVPVFLEPAKREARASLEALRVEQGRVHFSLWSRGTVHVRPLTVKLSAFAEDGSAVFEKSADTWYVLAGTERRYDLGIPPEACAKVRSVRVEVRLPGAPLSAEVAAPQGACRP